MLRPTDVLKMMINSLDFTSDVETDGRTDGQVGEDDL